MVRSLKIELIGWGEFSHRTPSSPRRRGSNFQQCEMLSSWIPACAGTTFGFGLLKKRIASNLKGHFYA
jgi:hypothetical protein